MVWAQAGLRPAGHTAAAPPPLHHICCSSQARLPISKGTRSAPTAPRVAVHHQPDGLKVRDSKVADLAPQLLHCEGGLGECPQQGGA